MEHLPHSARERREFFLSKAEEAASRATASADDQARRAWLDIAESWRFLAEQVARKVEQRQGNE